MSYIKVTKVVNYEDEGEEYYIPLHMKKDFHGRILLSWQQDALQYVLRTSYVEICMHPLRHYVNSSVFHVNKKSRSTYGKDASI